MPTEATLGEPPVDAPAVEGTAIGIRDGPGPDLAGVSPMDNQTPQGAAHGATYPALTFSFLAGGLAGATVALLLAPQAGRVTRQLMRRKLSETADSARELKGRAIRRGQQLREEATHRVEGAASALAGKAGDRERGNGNLEDGSAA